MAISLYKPGDVIVLKARAPGSIGPSGQGRILAVLPRTQASMHYRVRLHDEGFDRNVSQDEIDDAASTRRQAETSIVEERGFGTSWIKPAAIRTKK